MAVAGVSVRYAVTTGMRLSWETTQKKLSLAWETTMAPAPMASTESTRPMSESRPSAGSSGRVRTELVTMATVEDPCAVFSAAEMMNGTARPRPRLDRVSPRNSVSGEAASTAPNAAPDPVISRIGADTRMPSLTRSPKTSSLPRPRSRNSEAIRPMARAMTGVPRKVVVRKSHPSPNGAAGSLATDAMQMSTSGVRMGRKAMNALGSLP